MRAFALITDYLVFDLERKKIGWGDVNLEPGGCGDVEAGDVAPHHRAAR